MSGRALRPILVLAVLATAATIASAGAEVVQKGALRVVVAGKLSPQRLPRSGSAPVAVSVSGQISTTDQSPPAKLKTLQIELNRHGHLDSTGLPTCPRDAIQTASTSRALSACRSALVGRGTFNAEITLSGQEPYPAKGTLLAFNGREGGKPVLFGQIYAPRPFATSFVIVFSIKQAAKGTYGTVLTATLPPSLRSWGNLTGIGLTLSRRYSYKGQRHSYISAGCRAPKGFPGVSFPFAKASFGFETGLTLSSTLTRSCRVSG